MIETKQNRILSAIASLLFHEVSLETVQEWGTENVRFGRLGSLVSNSGFSGFLKVVARLLV